MSPFAYWLPWSRLIPMLLCQWQTRQLKERQVVKLPTTKNLQRKVDISIFIDSDATISQDWLSAVAYEAMNVALEETESGHLSIALVDDSTVQELNARFRGLDEITDVLSFSTTHPGHWQSDSNPPSDTLSIDPTNIDPFSFLECHNELPDPVSYTHLRAHET